MFVVFAFLPLPPVVSPVVFHEPPKVAGTRLIDGFALDPTDELVGRVIHVDRVPMPLDELLRCFAGVTTGPDGNAWLAGGTLSVVIDGSALGELTQGMISERRPGPEPDRRLTRGLSPLPGFTPDIRR
jgi:hypothetical protein